LQHGSGECCQGSIFLADGPHAEPPWLFLLGWYPSGFMMQYKGNEILADWKRFQAPATFKRNSVAQRTQGTQNALEAGSRKERRERKVHWKRGRAKNARNAKFIGRSVPQSMQRTQNALEKLSRKERRERKV
jgi:hypothetical protein